MKKLILILFLFSFGYSVRFHSDTITSTTHIYALDTAKNQLSLLPIDSAWPDSVSYADTAGVSLKSILTVHGVDSGTVPQAFSDSTFANTPITISDDSVKITFSGTLGDTFTNSGVSGATTIYSGCTAPNGNCYFGVGYSGFYIQSGGVGVLSLVTSESNFVHSGMASDTSGNIYASCYGGWIFKRVGGAGSFDSIPGTIKNWYDIECDKYNLLYGVVQDTLFTSVDAGTTWVFFQEIDGARKITAVNNGDMYCIDASGDGDIHYKVDGGSSFYSIGNYNYWLSIGCDTSGNIFAGTSTSDGVYERFGGTGDFIKIQETYGFYDFFGKINGTAYGVKSNQIWQKSDQPSITILNLSGGDADIHGKLSIDNTPITETPVYLLGKNVEPDYEIKKIPIFFIGDSLFLKIGTDSILIGER